MRLRHMTIKRWMIVIGVAAVDLAIIKQCLEGPTTPAESVGMFILILHSPATLFWLLLAGDEPRIGPEWPSDKARCRTKDWL